MRRACMLLAFLLIALPSLAEEITVDKVISAHQFGAPPETIVAKINDPANTVAPVATTDMARLQTAGVPDAVVNALVARAPKPTPEPPPTQPDNPALVDLVRLLKSGLSEKIVADQIRQGGIQVKPTLNDLIYLKESGVQEVIIVALMEAPLKSDLAAQGKVKTGATLGPEGEVAFDGLVFKRGGVFKKNPTGKLVLKEDKLAWRDSSDASRNFELFIKGVKQLTVTCVAKESGNFCHEVTFDFTKGDDYTFEDAKKDVGGNENLLLLLDVLKVRYPDLPTVEKAKS